MRTELTWAPLVAAVATASACTFPDVDYADGGGATASGSSTASSGAASSSAATGGGMPCAVPPGCTKPATDCAKDAEGKYGNCVNKCKAVKACMGQCKAAMSTALTMCSAACASCGASMCADMPTNCDALVGL